MRQFVKKHYVKVAEILRELDPGKFVPNTVFHSRVVEKFSRAFESDCPNKFDLNKFQKACYKK